MFPASVFSQSQATPTRLPPWQEDGILFPVLRAPPPVISVLCFLMSGVCNYESSSLR